MKQQKIICYEVLRWEEIAADEQNLLQAAWEATDLAYAPYSEFYVGCAVLLQNGEIIKGNNQENLAYPSGLCAERTALYFIGSQGKGHLVEKIAIRARCKNFPVHKPITPCGSCCQAMVEYEALSKRNFILLMMGEDGTILRIEGVKQHLLPFYFDAEF